LDKSIKSPRVGNGPMRKVRKISRQSEGFETKEQAVDDALQSLTSDEPRESGAA
jgi:hypothetical protein